MLLCNNTAIQPICLINRDALRRAVLPRPARGPILSAMSEDDDLARRFFALWTEYLTALVSDPKTAEPLRRWVDLGLALATGSLHNAMPGDARAGAPPGSTPSGSAPPGSPADAAAAAGPSGERDAAVAELARRVDELQKRVAALERPGERPGERGGRAPGGTRGRNRAARP